MTGLPQPPRDGAEQRRYPQREFPYRQLRAENARRGRDEPEYELADTGVLADDRFFDVDVSYAKAGPEDVCLRIAAANCGPDPAPLHVLPQIWFRNTWSWGSAEPAPRLSRVGGAVHCEHPVLGEYWLAAAAAVPILVTGNDTNAVRLFGADRNVAPYTKDGINDHVVSGAASVDPSGVGTRAAYWYRWDAAQPGQTVTAQLRLTRHRSRWTSFGPGFEETLRRREAEAAEFYAGLLPGSLTETERVVARRGFGDVNPPVQAWAALRVFQIDAARTGRPDRTFLVRIFGKLLLNFSWWVNRKDADGSNLFEGGFLGMDNISAFDRSTAVPAGCRLEQSDATSWMATYALARVTSRREDGALLLSLLAEGQLRPVLERLLDEGEFLSRYGIRSLSAAYRGGAQIDVDGVSMSIDYEPAESRSGLFGGNSNWRGPVWLPVNVMLAEALARYGAFFGPGWRVDLPTGSGNLMPLTEVAEDLERRLVALFLPDLDGHRPGDPRDVGTGPLWSAHPTFSEYFHGDTGQGLGASHQTGWTALVAALLTTR